MSVFLSTWAGSAADVTWSSAGSSTPGGTGNWNGGTTWWNGSSAVSWTTGDNATFSAAGNTTVNSNVTAGNLTFSSGTANISILDGAGSLTVNNGITATNTANTAARTYTISESSLILGANQTWTVNNGGSTGTANLAVSSAVSGSNLGITKAGNGTLTLSGANTFNGAVTVSSGTLISTNAAGLGNGTQISMGASTRLDVRVTSGQTWTMNQTLAANGSFTMANGQNGVLIWNGNLTNSATTASTVFFNSTGTGTNEFAGVIQNTTNNSSVDLNFQNTQIWKLTGNNTFSGAVTIGGGSVIADKLANQGNASSIGTGGVVRFGYFDNAPTTFEYVGSGATSNMQIRLGASPGTTNNNASFLHNGSGALTLTNANFTLTGQGGDPAATRVLVLGGNNTANNTIQGIIGNAGTNATIRLTKTGTGLWILSGNNTYTGGTTVSAGTLQVGHANALGTTGNITFGGGTLKYGSGITADLSSRIKSSASVMAIDTNGQSVTYASVLDSSNSGGLTKNGSGTLTLNASNTYTGATTINAGTLQIANANATSSGNITFGGGTLQYGSGITADISSRLKNSASAMAIDTNGNTVAFSSVVDSTNSGGLTKNGTGTLTLSANNTYTGTTTVNAGTLALGANLALQNSVLDTSGAGNVTLASGITTPTLGGLSGSKDLSSVITGNYNLVTALTLNPGASQTATYSGNITNGAAGMSLTKSGAGTQVLSGAGNTYSGATIINAGTLAISSNISSSAITLNTGGTISAGTTTAVGSFNAASMTIGTGTGYAFTIGNVNASVAGTDYDQITLTGALTLNNTSGSPLTVSLFGTPTGWTNNGTYSWNIITAGSITGFSASNFVTDFTNFGITSGNRAGSWTFSNSATNLILTYDGSAPLSTWSGGAGNWSAGFSPALTTNASLSYTGTGGVSTNDIASGTLGTITSITFASGAGAYTLNATTGAAGLAGGTPLTVLGSIINNSANSQTVNLNLAMNAARTVDAAAGNITLGGVISGNGSISKTGSNTLTLSGNNTYTGVTTISAGTLQIGAGGTSGSVSGNITNNADLVFNRSDAVTWSNAISGTGNLTKASGSGTLTLSGANTFNGAVTVSSGTLISTNAAGLGNGTQISMGNGTQLDVRVTSGETWTMNQTLSANGILTMANGQNGVLIWNGNMTNSATSASEVRFNSTGTGTNEFAGVIQNTTNNSAVSLNFQNTQIWKLTGNNTFSGGITIGGGRVIADKLANTGNASSIGTGGVVRFGYFNNAGSTFEYVGSGATSNMQIRLGASGDIPSGNASFLHNGSGALTLTNANFTLVGDVNPASATTRTLIIGGNNSANNTIQGIIANGNTNATIQLTKSGTGLWILSGNNTYTGGTTISAGTLQIGHANALGTTGNITFGGGTLQYGSGITADLSSRIKNSASAILIDTSGQSVTYASVLDSSNSGGLTKNGSGTLTLNASNTYTGTTTINAGTLALGANNVISSNSNVTISGGTMDMGSYNDTVGAITITSGNLTGTGTLTGASYTLQGGTVGANLGTGTLNATAGTTALNGTAAATTIALSGGNLTLGSANRLASGANLTLTSGTLTLGGAETVNALTVAGGNLAGSGNTITASTYTLQGGTVGANLGTGTLNATAGTTALNGTAAATTIALSGGNLTLGSANRLASGANLTLTSGTLTLGGAETVNALTMAGGNLAGSGNTLTAGTYTLQGGTVGANLGTGTLNATAGTTALNGTAAATTIALSGGNLTLGSANRLASGANLTLTSGTLTLGGNEAVNRLTLAGGTLAGSGTFNATMDYDVQSGNISASLGGTAGLGKTGAGTVVLSGNNTYTGTTMVSAGTLRLGASNILSDSSNLTVSGGTFEIGAFNETVNVLTMTNGTLLGTTGVLTGATYNITGGTVNAILGGGTIIVGNGTTNIAQIGSTTSLTVNGSSAIAALTANVVASTVSVQNGGSITGAFSLNASGGISANSGSIASNLIGSGGLTMNGAGNTLTLTGSNTYTGATTLSAGTLSINAAAALGSTSGVGMANGTTLAYTGAAGNLTRAISVTSGTGTIQNSGSGLLTLSGGLSKNGTTMVLKGGSNGITVNGAITGTAANSDLILDGGSITLASANTYNGPTYLLNGTTLTASVANALPTANGRTDVTMDATGSGSSTLALGASQSVASLTGAASSNVTLGSNTLTIGTTSGNTTFAGSISGSGNLVKDGASTQVLSGTNTFTGTTTINSGTLQAASANALGSTSSVVVNNGGSLLVTADDAIGTNTNITLNSTSTTVAGLAFNGNYNGTVGLLTLSKDSIIDLGLGSVVLRFSDIVGLATHALKIYNWTGETLWGGTNRDNTDQIYVTADLNDPSRAGELGNISFYSDFGNSFLGNGYQLTGSGFYNNQIIPVPESETWLAAAILMLTAAAYSLRRKNDPGRNEPPA